VGRLYFGVNVLVLLGLALATVAGVRALPRRAGDSGTAALLVAGAPVLMLTATINWDLLAVAAGVLALLVWDRDRPVLAHPAAPAFGVDRSDLHGAAAPEHPGAATPGADVTAVGPRGVARSADRRWCSAAQRAQRGGAGLHGRVADRPMAPACPLWTS
jgi:hypothetical protein